MNFLQKLESSINNNNSLLCIGLDTDINKIPKHLLNEDEPIFAFNKDIIDKTSDLVCCYKANVAFYSAQGISGLHALQLTVSYLKEHYPQVPIILDAKRADIENTSEQYVKEAFDTIGVDAVTVNPYLGLDSLEPFFKRSDKGIIVLCRTSNPGASDFQNLIVNDEPLYISVAKKTAEWNKEYKNCLMVVGATWPDELKKIREIAPDMFFLVPGLGPQGGNLQKTLQNGLTKEKSGLIIHSARAIIFASNENDFAEKAREEARKLKKEINKYK